VHGCGEGGRAKAGGRPMEGRGREKMRETEKK